MVRFTRWQEVFIVNRKNTYSVWLTKGLHMQTCRQTAHNSNSNKTHSSARVFSVINVYMLLTKYMGAEDAVRCYEMDIRTTSNETLDGWILKVYFCQSAGENKLIIQAGRSTHTVQRIAHTLGSCPLSGGTNSVHRDTLAFSLFLYLSHFFTIFNHFSIRSISWCFCCWVTSRQIMHLLKKYYNNKKHIRHRRSYCTFINVNVAPPFLQWHWESAALAHWWENEDIWKRRQCRLNSLCCCEVSVWQRWGGNQATKGKF